MSLPHMTPDFNAHYLQVYPNNGNTVTITTACMVNQDYTPPYVTNLTPIDQSLFLGEQSDEYIQIVASGEIIRTYQTPQSGGESLKIG